jgi:hypothetical protein
VKGGPVVRLASALMARVTGPMAALRMPEHGLACRQLALAQLLLQLPGAPEACLTDAYAQMSTEARLAIPRKG